VRHGVTTQHDGRFSSHGHPKTALFGRGLPHSTDGDESSYSFAIAPDHIYHLGGSVDRPKIEKYPHYPGRVRDLYERAVLPRDFQAALMMTRIVNARRSLERDGDDDGKVHDGTKGERKVTAKAAATSLHRPFSPDEQAEVDANESRLVPDLVVG